MNTTRVAIVGAILIWIAGGLQQGIAHQVSIFGSPPDYLLTAACILGLLAEPRLALIFGFACGLVEGSIIGTDIFQFVVTRMLVAWLCSYLVENRFQRNFATASATTVACSLVAGIVIMIITLQSHIGLALKDTMITAVYNGVLALLAYVPIERATGVKSQQL